MVFPFVPHQDVTLSHHLELGFLPVSFVLSSVVVPVLRFDEDIGCSREVDFFKKNVYLYRRVPARDVLFALILWYVEKTPFRS